MRLDKRRGVVYPKSQDKRVVESTALVQCIAQSSRRWFSISGLCSSSTVLRTVQRRSKSQPTLLTSSVVLRGRPIASYRYVFCSFVSNSTVLPGVWGSRSLGWSFPPWGRARLVSGRAERDPRRCSSKNSIHTADGLLTENALQVERSSRALGGSGCEAWHELEDGSSWHWQP